MPPEHGNSANPEDIYRQRKPSKRRAALRREQESCWKAKRWQSLAMKANHCQWLPS